MPRGAPPDSALCERGTSCANRCEDPGWPRQGPGCSGVSYSHCPAPSSPRGHRSSCDEGHSRTARPRLGGQKQLVNMALWQRGDALGVDVGDGVIDVLVDFVQNRC